MHVQIKQHFRLIQVQFSREELKKWKKYKDWKRRLLLEELLPSVQFKVNAHLVEFREGDSALPPRIVIVERDSALLYVMIPKWVKLPRWASRTMLIPIKGFEEYENEVRSHDRNRTKNLLFLFRYGSGRTTLSDFFQQHGNCSPDK